MVPSSIQRQKPVVSDVNGSYAVCINDGIYEARPGKNRRKRGCGAFRFYEVKSGIMKIKSEMLNQSGEVVTRIEGTGFFGKKHHSFV